MTSLFSTSTRRRFIAFATVALLGLLWVFARSQPVADALSVQFAGFTNFPGLMRPVALFTTTNHSGATLNLGYFGEVKTGAWPPYGPDNYPRLDYTNVPPHQSISLTITTVPDYGSAWRLHVFYGEARNKWETRRSAWAASLRLRGMHKAARLIWRDKPIRKIVTTEMKV